MSRFGQFLHRSLAAVSSASHQVCFDVGSAMTRIGVAGQVVYHQPTCAVIHKETGSVIEVGQRAVQMMGKVPANLEVVFPVNQALIADPQVLSEYLTVICNQTLGKNPWLVGWLRSVAVCAVPSSASKLEQALWQKVLTQAGFSTVKLQPKSLSYVHRLRRPDSAEKAIVVCDVGSDSTEVCIIVGRRPVIFQTLAIGGRAFTHAVRWRIKTEYQTEIGWSSAQKVTHQLGNLATTGSGLDRMVIRGKQLISGLPVSFEVTRAAIQPALASTAEEFLTEIRRVLQTAPPELLATALSTGLYLTGGGSQLQGWSELITPVLKTQPILSTTPTTDVVLGLSQK